MMETTLIVSLFIIFFIALGFVIFSQFNILKKIETSSDDEKIFDEKFKNLQNDLNETFENLSNKVLVNQTDTSLNKMKNSLSELLENFNSNQKEKFDSLGNNSKSLLAELAKHKELTEIINSQNQKLNDVLSSPGPRGDWGELRVRTVLERAGLVEDIHFTHNKKTDTSKDRPDYVINLHDNKKLILDSKVPFTALKDFYATTDKNEKKKLIKKHSSETRKMMEDLAKKKYWEQYKSDNALPYVIMVLPSEAFLYTAFQGDESLFNDSVEKNVYLCSPLNLLAMMHLVKQGHTHLELNENAQQLVDIAKKLLNQSSIFNEKFKEIGYHAGKLVDAQRSAGKNLHNHMIPGLQKMEGMGASLPKGKELDPGIKLVEETPYEVEKESNEKK